MINRDPARERMLERLEEIQQLQEEVKEYLELPELVGMVADGFILDETANDEGYDQ